MRIQKGPEKPHWQKPELIILVRTKPEEAVLATCKVSSEIVTGPSGKTCAQNTGQGCQGLGNS